MSQLIKQENKDLSPDLSKSEVDIIRNSQGTKIINSLKGDVADLVTDIVDSSLIVLGFFKTKYAPNERIIIENEIVNDIISKFSHLSHDEIKEAVRLGCRGEFKAKPEDLIIFSVSTVYNWLKSYSDTYRREALKKQARFEQDNLSKPPPTEEERRQIEREFVWNCIVLPYRVYLETGEYNFDNKGNVIYNKLDKFGLIPFPTSIKKKFMEEAKELVIARLITSPSIDNQKLYTEVKEGKGEGLKLVKSQAKDIALREFFKELKDNKADLEQLLKE